MHIGRTLPPKAGQHLTVAKMTWTCNRPSNLLCWKLEGKTLRPRVTVSESTTICGLLLAFVLSFSSWTEKKNPILIGVTPSKVNYISVKKKGRKKEPHSWYVQKQERKTKTVMCLLFYTGVSDSERLSAPMDHGDLIQPPWNEGTMWIWKNWWWSLLHPKSIEECKDRSPLFPWFIHVPVS